MQKKHKTNLENIQDQEFVPVTMHINPKYWERMSRLAKQQGRFKRSVLNEALSDYLKRHEGGNQ